MPCAAAPSIADVARDLLQDSRDITRTDFSFSGKAVLLRVDLNVPLQGGVVSDDARLKAVLPTIRFLVEQDAKVVLLAHLGRPDPKTMSLDEMSEKFSLKHLHSLLAAELASAFAGVAESCVGPVAEEAIKRVNPGQVLLLENIRFQSGETKNDDQLSAALASLGDVYINDAFSVSHRAHASVVGIVHHLTAQKAAFPGLLLRKELQYLTQHVSQPERPFAVVVGGAKVKDKLAVITGFLASADTIVIGGRMAFTFLAARGVALGESHVDLEQLGAAAEMLQAAEAKGVEVVLPVDVTNTPDLDQDAIVGTPQLSADCCDARAPCVPDGIFGADIGPESCTLFSHALKSSRTVFWNGPMGRFEVAAYSKGTRAVANAIAELFDRGVVTIAGGGDTAHAIKQFGLESKFSHISTGGGAALELMEGRRMPGLSALLSTHG